MKLTEAGKAFIQKAIANEETLKLRFYGIYQSGDFTIGADIDTLINTDHIIEVEGYEIGVSPEVMSKLKKATIHAQLHTQDKGLILLNCK